jgi:putative aldouronate transport system permease protein
MSEALERFPPLLSKSTRWAGWKRSLALNYDLYIMLAIPMAWYIIFRYVPIYGIQIAFKDFFASKGILGSPWVGSKHFLRFFRSYYFWRLMRNTFSIALYALVIGFPAPIILALMMNELRSIGFKRVVQNVTYIPHFLSVVVVVGMIVTFTKPDFGIVNQIIKAFGGEPINFMIKKQWFRTMFVVTNIWQNAGWGAIIYMASLASIDPSLYEAATVDGATRFQKMSHISLPGILPTVVILFILRIGRLLNVAFHKILLMQNGLNMETSDVISTYVYRVGILEGNYSFSTAVGLFRALLNLLLIISANQLAKRMRQTSLW